MPTRPRPILTVPQRGSREVLSFAEWVPVLDAVGPRLAWSVHFLWALAGHDERRAPPASSTVRELSPLECGCAWSDLLALAKESHQIIDGVFVGRAPESAPPRFVERPTIFADFEFDPTWHVWLEALDSTCWYVAAHDPDVLQRTRETFGTHVGAVA